MKIEYTYQEPEDRPIKEAKFEIAGYEAIVRIGLVELPIIKIGGFGGTLQRADFFELERDNWELAMKVKMLENQNASLKHDNAAYRQFVDKVIIQARGVVENG